MCLKKLITSLCRSGDVTDDDWPTFSAYYQDLSFSDSANHVIPFPADRQTLESRCAEESPPFQFCSLLDHRRVTLILGARGTGKSTLVSGVRAYARNKKQFAIRISIPEATRTLVNYDTDLFFSLIYVRILDQFISEYDRYQLPSGKDGAYSILAQWLGKLTGTEKKGNSHYKEYVRNSIKRILDEPPTVKAFRKCIDVGVKATKGDSKTRSDTGPDADAENKNVIVKSRVSQEVTIDYYDIFHKILTIINNVNALDGTGNVNALDGTGKAYILFDGFSEVGMNLRNSAFSDLEKHIFEPTISRLENKGEHDSAGVVSFTATFYEGSLVGKNSNIGSNNKIYEVIT